MLPLPNLNLPLDLIRLNIDNQYSIISNSSIDDQFFFGHADEDGETGVQAILADCVQGAERYVTDLLQKLYCLVGVYDRGMGYSWSPGPGYTVLP